MLGFGLGYHVKALLAHIPPSSHVIVVEPQAAHISAQAIQEPALRLSRWVKDPRLHFSTPHDARVLPIHLADQLVTLRLQAIVLVPHVPSMQTREDFYRAALEAIPRDFPVSVQRHLQMIEQSLDHDLRNFWANLPSSWRGGDITAAVAAWAGRPAVIVAGGPSLSASLPALKEHAGSALIIATGSVAALLLTHGVRPDVVIAVDPYRENLSHFEGWDATGIPLVHYQRVYRGVLEVYAGPRVPFVMHDEPALPFRPAHASAFQRGGTVAFSALQFAHSLGANPIVFVGQDLAFAGGRTHTRGASHGDTFDPDRPPEEFIEVEAASGGTVVTSPVFHAFLLHMQEYLLALASSQPGLRHVNTAVSGARMRGMEYQAVEDVLNALPALPADAKSWLRQRLQTPIRVDSVAVETTVANWVESLRRLLHAYGFEERFPVIFEAFRATAIYDQASRGYDDLFYLYEARKMGAAPGAEAALCRQFRQHLRDIVADLSPRATG